MVVGGGNIRGTSRGTMSRSPRVLADVVAAAADDDDASEEIDSVE